MSAAGSAARGTGLVASVIERARRRVRRRRRGYGIVLLAVLGGVGLYVELGDGGGPSGGGGGSARPGSEQEPAQVLRNIEAPPGELRWTLVGAPCYDLVAEQIGGGDRGELSGSCVTKRRLSYSPGGIELGGQWYNVIEGTAGAKATQVRVSLVDGTTRTERIVDGVWLVVVPGPDPAKDNSFDVTRIETLDRAGAVLASGRPPSIRALYERVNRLNRAPTHVSG